MRVVNVSLDKRSYPVFIGKNIYSGLAASWSPLVKPSGVLLVSDENVFPLMGGRVTAELQELGCPVSPVVVPAGENSKTLSQAESLYTAAIEAGLDRSGLVVALGGGVVGDLAGFVAATYLRGVPYVQVPTTLLAQVDSSVGGKVAVNHPRGKNLIGAFYQPALVWAELDALLTLPAREFAAGAAEVIKYGAILSEPFFSYLERNWPAFTSREEEVLEEVVASCVGFKAGVVAADEREMELRAILNFGHTLGHALEAATDYRHFLHGEAVLAGMVLAALIAFQEGIFRPGDLRRLQDLCARAGFRAPPEGLCAQKVLEALRQDKKRDRQGTVFILPVRLGEVKKVSGIREQAIAGVLESYLGGELGRELARGAD